MVTDSLEDPLFKNRFSVLQNLVKQNFDPLTPAEADLFKLPQRVLSPLPAALRDHTSERTSERKNFTQPPSERDRQIRSELIEFLCTDSAVREHRYFSINASSARFDSRLNLSHLDVPFPLTFQYCEFPVGIDLLGATVSDLILTGSQLGSPAFNKDTPILQAESLHATGAVILREVKAYGEIRFTGAAIGRSLSLSEATLTHLSGVALTLDRAEIGGDLNLRRDFIANGEISLIGSKIHGNLDCRLATLNNPGNVALRADAAAIAGSVLLSAGIFEKQTIATKFHAYGEVRLYRAVIGGYLDCTGAVFDHPKGAGPDAISLNAESATIRGPSFLGFPFDERAKPGWGFHAKGRVRFFDASLGSNFIGHAGLFENPGGVALDLERAHISGSCLLRFRFRAQGQVCLVSTTIDDALDFDNADLSEADLVIRNTEIKRTLQFGAVAQPVQTRLDLTDTSCAVLTDDKNSWPVKGTLKLDGFAYRRLTHPGYSKDRLAWLHRQIPDTANPDGADFHPQPYRQLASVLRAQGLEDEAKRVLIGMTEDRRKWGGPSRGSWLLFFTIRNGYQPLRAFKALLILWCFGCLVFGIAYQSGLICPSDKDEYKKRTTGYESFCAPAYAIDSSLPIISFGQRDKWQPNFPSPPSAAKPSGGDAFAVVCELNFTKPLADSLPVLSVSTNVLLLKFFRWVYVAIGWFLTTMFVAGISGLAAKL